MDSATLNAKLKERMADLVTMLFPAAKIKGHIAYVGGMDGAQGDSCQIHIDGPRCGSFVDFANTEDKGGTPLYLWMKSTGKSYPDCIASAKEWLGIKDDDFGLNKHKPKRNYQIPERPQAHVSESNCPSMDYLTCTRKIDPIVVANNKIAETADMSAIIFPYLEPGEKKACHLKFLKIERGPDGKKTMWASKDTKRVLYGMQTIEPNSRHVVICEGEIDKLSWESLGQPCVSVPMGVNDMEWIDLCWVWLERFERIYLSMDMDSHGEEAVTRIAKRLGLHRCHVVTLPKKDANECLCNGFTRADAQKSLEEAKPIEIDEIQSPIQYSDSIWDMFVNKDRGYTTPWFPQVPWRIRPSEFTLFTGYDNSGKSCGLSHLVVDLRAQGAKSLIFSFEVTPQRTLQWMVRQALTKTPQSKKELDKALEWLTDGVWMYDYVGTADKNKMFEAMAYAAKRFGIDVFIIDSLFKCGISSEDYNAQKEFISQITDFCKETSAHVILVAHARKPPSSQSGRNDDRVPTRDEIAGTGDIKNGGFNVVVFWRNISKYQRLNELRKSAIPDLKTIAELEAKPDGRIRLDKQRFGDGHLGEIPTWFDGPSTQFKTEQQDRPKLYCQ